MAVDTFDPSAMGNPMDEAALRDLCSYAASFEGEELTLSELEAARFAALASHPGWAEKAQEIESEVLIERLIKVFTLGEMRYSSWSAGDKSPVIVLVKVLKQRGSYDASLTRWIKSHTTNKFLPHGSLMDRL